ncbi:trans-aconitate 2-methyltransferase [Pelagibius sp.]|uniref:class I SAM-dependent methyltransferase n=1 Tax=Pelagibius sp. TaxID=1931238 RepID=UPI0026111068|nr:class I SAM-dependent methyltransferase [Pelagibius sp.]
MTTQDDDRNTVDVFSSSLREHGQSFRALNWGSEEGQANRFRILCEIGIGDGDSVLDVGCGLGDLYGHLQRSGIGASYTGLDITPDMISTARQRFPDAAFREGSLLGTAEPPLAQVDYVLASGIFYLRRARPFEHLQSSVRRMFDLCHKGVAFNCLSSWGDAAGGSDEYREDPAQCLEFCRTVSPWAVLRHDYHPGDFTIYLRREAMRL